MKRNTINPQVAEAISQLDEYQQLKLLEFITALIEVNRPSKDNLLKYAGAIQLNELQKMEQAIKDCSIIDFNEW